MGQLRRAWVFRVSTPLALAGATVMFVASVHGDSGVPVPAAQADARSAAFDSDDSVQVVSRGANPVIRYPVIHQHTVSQCFGYLYFSSDAIWYEVLRPDKDTAHAFRRQRSTLTVAKRWAIMGTDLRGADLRFAGETYHFMHVTRDVVETIRKREKSDLRPFEDLLRAATAFNEAANLAGAGLPRLPASSTAAGVQSAPTSADPSAAAAHPIDCAETGRRIHRLQSELAADGAQLARLDTAVETPQNATSPPDARQPPYVDLFATVLRGSAADLDDAVAGSKAFSAAGRDAQIWADRRRELRGATDRLGQLIRRLSGGADNYRQVAAEVADYEMTVDAVIDLTRRLRSNDPGLFVENESIAAQAGKVAAAAAALRGSVALALRDRNRAADALADAQHRLNGARDALADAASRALRGGCTLRQLSESDPGAGAVNRSRR